MSRRRRAAALLGLAAVLGGLAASDVARREAAVRAQLAPLVPVVVAARATSSPAAGSPRATSPCGRCPERYAPAGVAAAPERLVGYELAMPGPARRRDRRACSWAVDDAVAAPPVEPGERAAEIVGLGAPDLVVPGARVDVLVTRDGDGGGVAGAELALEDVEVLAARPAPDGAQDDGAERVAATLRVTVRARGLSGGRSVVRPRAAAAPAGGRRPGAGGAGGRRSRVAVDERRWVGRPVERASGTLTTTIGVNVQVSATLTWIVHANVARTPAGVRPTALTSRCDVVPLLTCAAGRIDVRPAG